MIQVLVRKVVRYLHADANSIGNGCPLPIRRRQFLLRVEGLNPKRYTQTPIIALQNLGFWV